MAPTESKRSFDDFIDVVETPSVGVRVELRGPEGELGSVDRVLFLARSGAHLFGTADEESDLDARGVFVEPLDQIILGRDTPHLRFRTSGGPGAPSGPDDFEATFYELRRFIRDGLQAQPHALELLETPGNLAITRTTLWKEIVADRRHLISSSVAPFVGYCRNAARRFGETRRRLETVESVLEIMTSAAPSAPVRTVLEALPELEEVETVEDSVRDRSSPRRYLQVIGKRYELDAPIRKAVESLRSLRDDYASRTAGASAQPDWKDVSHAYRMTFELRELLATGGITFPLERADFLQRVKRGEVSYERVERELPALVDEVLEVESELPDQPNTAHWERRLPQIYYDLFVPR